MLLFKKLYNKLFGLSKPFTKQDDHIIGDASRKRDIDAEREKYAESDEPWVTVIGDGIDKGQLKLELDWNEAFIKFLLENGFTGKNDEEIVARWILMVHHELDQSTKN